MIVSTYTGESTDETEFTEAPTDAVHRQGCGCASRGTATGPDDLGDADNRVKTELLVMAR